MALIEWRDAFLTGDSAVDFEHKELVDLINQLYEKLDMKNADVDVVSEFLGEINAKISAHFALEERMMRAAGYVEFDDHKEDHEELLDDIREIMISYDDGAYETFADTLGQHLTKWFTRHFATFDARLHGALGHHD